MKKKPIPPRLLEASRRLRHHATPAERILWAQLRNRQLDGAKFRRQVVIGPYIVDFCCPARGVVIELDGAAHDTPAARTYDRQRQAGLEAEGYRVLRFRNGEVERGLPHVLEAIGKALQAA